MIKIEALSPIGFVRSTRKEALDDNWDSVNSLIELCPEIPVESLAGLDTFSHAEIIFLFNQVSVDKIKIGARHPRNNKEWPKVGIFAQRGKNRPNRLGTTICQIERVEGNHLYLKGLDAIDGTPVFDIKPWIKEFSPRGDIRQPDWVSQLMENYWS